MHERKATMPSAEVNGGRSELRARFSARAAQGAPTHGFSVENASQHNDCDPAIADAVELAKSGDMAAVQYLYLRYKNSVYGYVLSIVRDEHDAEDVTQHVFVKLVSAIAKYEPRQVPFTAWLIRVARNVAVDHVRRRLPVPQEEIYGPSASDDDADPDRRWGITQALETLPDDQRKVVIMRHLVGLTPTEISEKMGRTEASIHGLHHRARRAMQRELEQIDCAPTTREAVG